MSAPADSTLTGFHDHHGILALCTMSEHQQQLLWQGRYKGVMGRYLEDGVEGRRRGRHGTRIDVLRRHVKAADVHRHFVLQLAFSGKLLHTSLAVSFAKHKQLANTLCLQPLAYGHNAIIQHCSELNRPNTTDMYTSQHVPFLAQVTALRCASAPLTLSVVESAKSCTTKVPKARPTATSTAVAHLSSCRVSLEPMGPIGALWKRPCDTACMILCKKLL